MKCTYVLKHMFSDSISIHVKNTIDSHIGQCSYCQSRIASSDEVGRFLQQQLAHSPVITDWAAFLHDIRQYREKREHNWLSRLANMLPLEPLHRRVVVYGTVCSVVLLAIIWTSLPFIGFSLKETSDTIENNEFYYQEHALSQDTDFFGECTITETLASLEHQP